MFALCMGCVMKEIWKKYQLYKGRLLPLTGCLAVVLCMLPYFVLGEGSYIQVHDQMDGEILNYIYQAKYLFRGNVIPEFMNGMSKAAMTLPAPFGVLFYVFLPPFWAFVSMQLAMMLLGFWGMYLLLGKMGMAKEVCFVTGLLFACMPFYPTYGLAALGQPLLILCFWELLRGKKRVWPLAGIVLYAGFSSLTLVGYVWVLLGIVVGLVLRLRCEPEKWFLIGWGSLVMTYLLTNWELLASLGKNGFRTHREEMILSATGDLWGKYKELFFVGGSYSNVYSVALFVMAVVVLLFVWNLWFWGRKKEVIKEEKWLEIRQYLWVLTGLLISLVVLTGCAVLWNSSLVVTLRKMLGGIWSYFQADRVYWIFPFLWMLVLAALLEILRRSIKGSGLCTKGLIWGVCLILVALEGGQIFRDSNFNKNIRLLLLEDYKQVTWESLYMEDVFREIDRVVGLDKKQKSVVSMGIYPSVALYNGYICADGYSNNYDLSYKHAFRRIQEGELEKNPESKRYFDEWGNRLYLTNGQTGMNGMVGKDFGICFETPDYSREAMEELNIGYVFSAARVEGAEKLGWTLVEGSPYSSEKAYYAIWVYRINQE